MIVLRCLIKHILTVWPTMDTYIQWVSVHVPLFKVIVYNYLLVHVNLAPGLIIVGVMIET